MRRTPRSFPTPPTIKCFDAPITLRMCQKRWLVLLVHGETT